MMDSSSSSSNEDDNVIFEIKNELQKTIVDTFMLFSPYGKNVIPTTDIGKVIRQLGCVPSEEELAEFINNVVHKKHPNIVKLDIFALHMENQIKALKYKPGTMDELLWAFQVLDKENKGSLSVEFVRRALREGESFDDDEIAETLKTVYDRDSDCIHYDVWVHKLMGRTKMNVYALIPVDGDGATRPVGNEEKAEN